MSKILITGGRGFLGTNLTPLLSKKHDVVVFDKEDGNDIFGGLEYFVKEADVVIHLAALTSVHDSFINPGKTFVTNVLGTARVARFCVKYHKKLIYPSTAAVIHPDLSPYAHSKWVAESIVKGIMSETPVTILRFVNMFGPHMNSRSGSMMYNFLHNDKIVVYGDGEQTRDFIHVRDTTRIIKDALKKKWDGKIVDVGTGQPYSTNYVAGLFAHYRGKKISYEPPKREMRWHAVDTTILKSLYNYPLTTNLEKDIKELCLS